MSGDSAASPIQGLVLLDGRPAAGQRVLALSADMTRFLAAAVTGDDGRYRLEVPSGAQPVLVARIQGPVLALAFRETRGDAAESHDFRFDSTSPGFCTVRGTIVPSRDAAPPVLDLSVTPAHLRGVPAAIEPFFLRQSESVVDAAFYETHVRDTFALRLQRGRYRIAGSYIIYDRPTTTGQRPPNVIVGRVEADGERGVPAERFGSFTLDVDRDRAIRLHLAVLPNQP